jgi:hypothetical protein
MRSPRAFGRRHHGSPACSVADVSPSDRERKERNEKRRLRRAKKSLEDEAKGLRKRGLNKTTRELLHTSDGKPLAKDVLEACMLDLLALLQHLDPLDRDADGRGVNPRTGAVGPPGDTKLYLDMLEATARFAKWLAPFQSPKRSAVAVGEASSEIQEQTSFTLDIFKARGEQVSKIINGEEAEGNDEAAPLAPLGREPAKAGDIGGVVDTSLQETTRADDPQTPRYQPHVEGIPPPRIKPGR